MLKPKRTLQFNQVMTTFFTSLTATDFTNNLICHTINTFYKRRLHKKNERPPNMIFIFALLITGVNFAYLPLLQMLPVSPNAYLNDDVC